MTVTTTAAATRQVIEAERARRMRERAGSSLIDWVRMTSPSDYDVGWVHRVLCEKLEWFSREVAAKRSPRLMIEMPPRHGKSHIVSQRFPVWHMARNARHEVICASYGADLAEDHSRDARSIASDEFVAQVFGEISDGEQYGSRRGESDRVSKWVMPNGSSYTAVGVGGALTGRGAHVAIIDDPFKDRQDADSPAQRRKVWRWYLSTLYTRLAPGAGIIVMNTRWHPDDLTGRLVAQEANAKDEDGPVDRWERVTFAAIAESDEPPWRLAGEALHESRFGVRRLSQIKATLTATEGPREWAALYQQRPVPDSGGQIHEDWLQSRYTMDPKRMAADCEEIWISVDAAKKAKDTNDLHAIHVWGRRRSPEGRQQYVLLDRRAGRWTYPQFEKVLDDLISEWGFAIAHTGGGALIEDTANGATYLQVRGPVYRGVSLIAFSPNTTPGADKSKGARAVYLERAAEAGALLLPDVRVSPWINEVITWWVAFPLGKHDDDVDAASQLLMRWATEGTGTDASHVNRYLAWAAG